MERVSGRAGWGGLWVGGPSGPWPLWAPTHPVSLLSGAPDSQPWAAWIRSPGTRLGSPLSTIISGQDDGPGAAILEERG